MATWLTRDRSRPLLIGVVHLAPSPGSPRYAGDPEAVLEGAVADAAALFEGEADALIVENFGDAPFFAREVPSETIAFLARAIDRIAQAVHQLPLGVNVLRNDARSALGLCAAGPASFLRINVHVGAMATDQGVIEGRAAETLRERARLCPQAAILADVHVKHAAPLVSRPIAETAAETAQRGLADALVVTGSRTGAPPDAGELAAVRERVPETVLLIGSGLDASNARELAPHVDGAIVGTALKRQGRVDLPVELDRVRRVREALGGF